MRKLYTVVTFLLFSLACMAQQADSTSVDGENDNDEGVISKPDNSGPLKIGIKLGVGYSSMLGGELENPIGTFGLQGSAYLRYRFKPKFAIQTEVGASFRGSNFNNDVDEYTTIKTYYIDVPVLFVFGLNKTATSNLIIGPQYSRLLNSSIYISNGAAPEPDPPKLKKNDLLAVLGAQFYTPFVGFQVLAKYGLININDGLLGANTKPAYKGKDIHNLAIEFNIIF
jgi:hypothetical protein